MTGRTGDCGRGQGCGSGRGYLRNKKYSKQSQQSDKKEMKFVPKMVGKSQACTFKTVKECVLQELQKDLVDDKDIATNLRKGEDTGIGIEKPERKVVEKKEMTDKKGKCCN